MSMTEHAMYSGIQSLSSNLNAQAYSAGYFQPGDAQEVHAVCVMQGFAMDASRAMIESIAINPNTPTAVLRKLVQHNEPDVRAALAENRSTPIDALYELVTDENPDVRFQLAENHQIPVEILKLLADDENPYVSCRAQKTLRRVEETSKGGRIGWSAFRRSQSIKGLRELSECKATSQTVLRRLCANLTRYALG